MKKGDTTTNAILFLLIVTLSIALGIWYKYASPEDKKEFLQTFHIELP